MKILCMCMLLSSTTFVHSFQRTCDLNAILLLLGTYSILYFLLAYLKFIELNFMKSEYFICYINMNNILYLLRYIETRKHKEKEDPRWSKTLTEKGYETFFFHYRIFLPHSCMIKFLKSHLSFLFSYLFIITLFKFLFSTFLFVY